MALILKPIDREALERIASRRLGPTVPQMAAIVLRYADGVPVDRICGAFSVSEDQVRKIILRYRTGMLRGLGRSAWTGVARSGPGGFAGKIKPGASVPRRVVKMTSGNSAIAPSRPPGRSSPASMGGVERTEGICGGDARIAGTRIPVWSSVEARSLGATEAQILLDYPMFTALDLVNAWRYRARHPGEIEEQIRRNEAA